LFIHLFKLEIVHEVHQKSAEANSKITEN